MFDDLGRVLSYTTHGGSGFGFTRRCVMDMGLGEAIEHAEWLQEQRRREASAIKRASSAK